MSSKARALVRTYAVADLAAPAPRKRGRPPGSHNPKKQVGQPPAKGSMEIERVTSPVSATEDIDGGDGEMPAAPAPRKRGRPLGSKNTKQQASQPPAKKSKVTYDVPIATLPVQATVDNNSANAEMPASPSPKRTARHRIALPARSPLPVRSNRVTNPGAPDRRRARRTSAEVTAANKAKMDLKERLEQLEREKIEALAALEVQEELDDEVEKQALINNIGDLGCLHSDDEEKCIFEEEDGMEGNPDDKEEPTLVNAPAKKSGVVWFIV